MPRYFTKTRFSLALDCSAKLYYSGKPEYIDTKNDDAFLAALAEGGFQVGELARCYFEGGILDDRGERHSVVPAKSPGERWLNLRFS